MGHRLEKLERLAHPLQNGLGALRRQSDRERGIRVRPDQDQHVHLAAALREVDLNLSKIGLHPLPRLMVERNERLSIGLATTADKTPHRVVTTFVAVLVPQPLEEAGHRMPLLGGSPFVFFQQLPNDFMQRPQLRRHLPLPRRINLGLAKAAKHLPDLPPRMMKGPGDLANAHAIAMRPPNASKIVHRKHPCLRKLQLWAKLQHAEEKAVGPISAPISPPTRVPFTSRSPCNDCTRN